jgi:hypothetical protein
VRLEAHECIGPKAINPFISLIYPSTRPDEIDLDDISADCSIMPDANSYPTYNYCKSKSCSASDGANAVQSARFTGIRIG